MIDFVLWTVLFVLSVKDIYTRKVPNQGLWVMTGLWIAMVYLGALETGYWEGAWSFFVVYLTLFAMVFMAYMLQGQMILGLGDVKLYAVMALYVGWQNMPCVILGSVVCSPLGWFFRRDFNQGIPFVPCMTVSFLCHLYVFKSFFVFKGVVF